MTVLSLATTVMPTGLERCCAPLSAVVDVSCGCQRPFAYKLWTAWTSTVGAVTRPTAAGADGHLRPLRLLYCAAVQQRPQ